MRKGIPVLVAGALGAALAAWIAFGPRGAPDADPAPASAPQDAASAEPDRAVLEGRHHPADAAAPAADPVRKGEVTGRVIDAHGVPVLGAAVVALVEDVEVGHGATDSDGAFAIAVDVSRRAEAVFADVVASHEDRTASRRVAFGASPEADGSVDVGDLRLRASIDVLVQVVGGDPADPPVVYARLLERASSRVRRATTDARGVAAFRGLPEGPYRLLALAKGKGRASVSIRLPLGERAPVVLELQPERVVEVRVRDAATRKPVVGAHVSVMETLPGGETEAPVSLLTTSIDEASDADGVVRIRGLGREDAVSVAVTASGYGWPAQDPLVVVSPADDAVEVALAPARSLRWKLSAEGRRIPAEGSRVTFLSSGVGPVPAAGRVEDGSLVAEGWPPATHSAFAMAPDGAIARVYVSNGEKQTPVAFYPPASVRVSVRSASGDPLAGWRVFAEKGGAPLGARAASTDAEGRAVLGGLYGGPRSATLVRAQTPRVAGVAGRTFDLGDVPLDRGDARFDAVVPDPRDVLVQVRLDGVLRLPPLATPTALSMQGLRAALVERDEGRSVLRSRWRPGPREERLTVWVEAEGYAIGVDSLRFAPGWPPPELRMAVDLQRGAAVEVQVRSPPDGAHAVGLEVHMGGAWKRAASQGEMPLSLRADRGVVVFPRVQPGLDYRAVDDLSGVVSEPARVAGGPDRQVLTLDLSRTAWLAGRVLGPNGAPPDGRASVTVGAADPKDADGPARVVRTLPDGSFRVRATFLHPIRLRANHVALVDAAAEGVVLSAPSSEALVLRLVGR